jgi:hypothetical protein
MRQEQRNLRLSEGQHQDFILPAVLNVCMNDRRGNYREDLGMFAKPAGIFSIPARRNFAGHRAPLRQRTARGPLSNNFRNSGGGVWALGEQSA